MVLWMWLISVFLLLIIFSATFSLFCSFFSSNSSCLFLFLFFYSSLISCLIAFTFFKSSLLRLCFDSIIAFRFASN